MAIKRGKDTSGTELYHHAEFHTDRLHLRRDIPFPDKTQTKNTED